MKPYRIKANRLARQAWMYLGQAREARFNYGNAASQQEARDAWHMIRHHVRTARMSMGTAILYRQMDGRL